MKTNIKVRLFSSQTLSTDTLWQPDDRQIHYLLNVLRLNVGDEIKIFDGQSGEYIGQIYAIGKKNCSVKIMQKIREMEHSPDLWLLFAPVKKDKTDFIIAGATELGVSRILPTMTERTICERVNKERFEAQVIEAAEQCRRLDIPLVCEPQPLQKILQTWPQDRMLFFMDETGSGGDICNIFQNTPNTKAAVLVGPEGGFSEKELELLRKQSFTKAVSMGKRILRAETAVLTALSCWQAICGDWNERKSK